MGSVAWPDLNVLCALVPSGYGRSGLIIPKTQSASSHPSLSHPLWWGLPRRSVAPLTSPGLNASPVTGCSQCQFSCYMHSGARPGLHKETSEGVECIPACCHAQVMTSFSTLYYVIIFRGVKSMSVGQYLGA